MPLLINGKTSVDAWVALDADDYSADAKAAIDHSLQQKNATIYPLAVYLTYREQLSADPANTGVLVTGDDNLSSLSDLLSEVSLIAIDFPVVRDGRGFSIARNVTRRGFSGEVRAVGDVSYDRLDNMQRSGFNAFQIAEDRYTDDAHQAFTEMTVNYQPTHLR